MKTKKLNKPKTKTTKKPGVTDHKPPANPPTEVKTSPGPGDTPIIDGGKVAPLDPGELPIRIPEPSRSEPKGEKDKGGRPKLTPTDKRARAEDRKRQAEEEQQEEKQKLVDRIDATTAIIVASFTAISEVSLPPPLSDREKAFLHNCWRPLVELYGGDIPPAAAALLGTAIVFIPRMKAAAERAKAERAQLAA